MATTLEHTPCIVLNRCPHGVESLSLDVDGSGVRFVGPKCCGRWEVMKSWPMSAAELRSAANEFECMADQVEHDDA